MEWEGDQCPSEGTWEPPIGGLARLTERERQVLALVAQGKSTKEIARALLISHSAVKAHVGRILHKLGAKNRLEAGARWWESRQDAKRET